jgi:hypothetical protein
VADLDEKDGEWGHSIAKVTFVATIISVILFVGAVVYFILSKKA